MGAAQVGGIATLLDIDFENAAGFAGVKVDTTEAHFIVYYFSHAMMFCVGALIEAHVVLTPASCVASERFRFEVFGGTHSFLENSGHGREVNHVCTHRGYNHTGRWDACSTDNLALLVLSHQFYFHKRESGTEFVMNRLRYGAIPTVNGFNQCQKCVFYGWGSRRNGFLIPLLITMRKVELEIKKQESCLQMFNYGNKYLCLQPQPCKNDKHGVLSPDDLGTVLICNGILKGIMTSRLIDRTCGVGFLDMAKYQKFLTCGVDDSRDIIGHNDVMEFEMKHMIQHPTTPLLQTVSTATTT